MRSSSVWRIRSFSSFIQTMRSSSVWRTWSRSSFNFCIAMSKFFIFSSQLATTDRVISFMLSSLSWRCATISLCKFSIMSSHSFSAWCLTFSRSNSSWFKRCINCSFSSRWIRSRASFNSRLICDRSSFIWKRWLCSSRLILSRSCSKSRIALSNAALFSFSFWVHFMSKSRLISPSDAKWLARWAIASLYAWSINRSCSFSNWHWIAFIFSRSNSIAWFIRCVIAAWFAACFSDSCFIIVRRYLHSASNATFFIMVSLVVRVILCISKLCIRSSFAFIQIWLFQKNINIF